ncbi:OmpA family protein [Planobacterium oryzisoli]|uniref:OmpA family protein n=1 Tax=Planobacterium oryzisoli TaxID=2771435 RepID=A0A931E6M4_9FLAO|nr:OmpA family protein [Planobacterium oryzisoli]MBF5026706.1 OmpA family protein [Planobacterium oryzisoli]
MNSNLIDLMRGQLGPALVSKSATQLGESESGISRSFEALLPAVLAALGKESNHPVLHDAIMQDDTISHLGTLGEQSAPGIFTTLSDVLFKDRISGLENAVANFADVSPSAVQRLLPIVLSAVTGIFSRYRKEHNLDRDQVSRLLSEQAAHAATIMPAGLSLGAFGLVENQSKDPVTDSSGHTFEALDNGAVMQENVEKEVEVNRAGETHVYTEAPQGDSSSIWKWLLPLLLLLAAGYFLFKQCDNKEVQSTVVEVDSTRIESDTVNVLNDSLDSRTTTTIALPNNASVEAYEGGIEQQITTFLSSPEYAEATNEILKDRWFDFDNLNFEFGTTQLTPESQVQLENIRSILKAYPDAKIKIGAYSDRKGDDQLNLELSQKRAEAVKSALNSAQVVEAEGYGEQFSTVAESASDQQRQIDRRTSIRFVK